MRPSGIGLAAAAIVFLLLLTGCGQAVSPGNSGSQRQGRGPATASVRGDDPPASWANDYCVAVTALVDRLATLPSVDPSTPERASVTASDMLATVIGGLDGTVGKLKRLGESPVPGGNAIRDEALTKFDGIRGRANVAKQSLDTAPGDPAATQRALGAASAPMTEIAHANLLGGFELVPALAAAAKRAPACLELTEEGPAPSLGTEPPRR